MEAVNDAALDILFRSARSFNGYRGGAVTEEDIRAIYELLKMGPTATNQHPARFVWCLGAAARAKLAGCAADTNAEKIRAAPAAVIVAMDLDFHEHLPALFPHIDARPWFADANARETSAFRNSSLQGAYLILAARALGFDTGPMSGFDETAVEAAFFPDQPNIRVNFISTLGRGDPDTIFERLPRPAFDAFNRVEG